MKVCLINPPITKQKKNEIKNSASIPYAQNLQHPGVATIASYLASFSYEIEVIECDGQGIGVNETVNKVINAGYDCVGISVYYYNLLSATRIATRIKNHYKPFLFAGGYYASLNCRELFQMCSAFDCCVVGEGEETVLELVEHLKNNPEKVLSKIKGLAYMQDGEVFYTMPRPKIENLDKIPLPQVTFIENGLAGIVSSRGCYGTCTFCSIHRFGCLQKGRKIRYRSVDSIISEIVYLKDKFDVKYIWIYDDNFLCSTQENKARLHEFCRRIKEERISIKFYTYARVNDVINNKDTLNELINCGLDLLFVGIESFVPRQLKLFDKNTSVEENIMCMSILNSLPISYSIGMIYIDPWVTIEEISSNLSFLIDNEYGSIQEYPVLPLSLFGSLFVVPGSKLYDLFEKEHVLQDNQQGFRVLDKNVRYFLEIKKKWEPYVYEIYQYGYLLCEHGLTAVTKLLFDLVKIDLRLLSMVCSLIQNKEEPEIRIMQTLSKGIKELQTIKEKCEELSGEIKCIQLDQ